MAGEVANAPDVGFGSWLCENAKPLKDDRRSLSSKTVLGHQLVIAFNFKIELKKGDLRARPI